MSRFESLAAWGMWVRYSLSALVMVLSSGHIPGYLFGFSCCFCDSCGSRLSKRSAIAQFTDNSWSERDTIGSRIWPLTLPTLKVRIVFGFLSTKICTNLPILFTHSRLWLYEVTLPYGSIEERLWLIYNIKQVKLLTSCVLLNSMCGSGFILE